MKCTFKHIIGSQSTHTEIGPGGVKQLMNPGKVIRLIFCSYKSQIKHQNLTSNSHKNLGMIPNLHHISFCHTF